MRIECPACAAAYEVPTEKLAPGRKVRCARCKTDWVPIVDEAQAIMADDEEPLVQRTDEQHFAPPPMATAMDRLAMEVRTRPRRSPALALAWVVSFAVLAALLWSAYAWRTDIMRVWAPSERVYSGFGLNR